MKLSDDEARELDRLERTLRADDPGLDRRLRGMRQGGMASLHGVLALFTLMGVGVVLATIGDLSHATGWMVFGALLSVVAPVSAVVWWARRYYCRYCAGKWPAPDRSCPRCARPTPA